MAGKGRKNPPIDRVALARLREERYEDRKARIEADTHLHPRVKAAFLDRTLINNKGWLQLLDLSSVSRISILRSNSRVYGTGQHPAVLPDMDETFSDGDVRPQPQTEIGRALEWAVDSGRMLFNYSTGKFVVNPHFRGGRPRKPRAERWLKFEPRPDARRAKRGKPRPPRKTID